MCVIPQINRDIRIRIGCGVRFLKGLSHEIEPASRGVTGIGAAEF
jgi:hypothetical protein